MANLVIQLSDFRLTTAEILYHMPDYPQFLQTYLWQEYDLDPHFPRLRGFLDFWTREIDGKLHSVRVGNRALITAAPIGTTIFEYQV